MYDCYGPFIFENPGSANDFFVLLGVVLKLECFHVEAEYYAESRSASTWK
jgi:hypothetical protein